ncbi:NAD(P)/FAD-dependent oxidoreductase [Sphingomonas flavescens]|uniref:NAD(P)/FAD-dependent oxidoreductase n=1 Tax=Sphingomonas flavescens TaxID=3132797 RepID=UPI0028040C0C|nr:NAD(P)/FAD-dependent oxidoreductase [Sphingomonas limnosediminicola]
MIVGAGFGGLAAAKRLAGKRFDVTIVDRRNHHVFQPLLYQVATAAVSPADIAGPIRAIFAGVPNVRVLLDEVSAVEPSNGWVRCASGRVIGYDHLILATGARHSYFGHDKWARHARGLKSIDDALAIRRQILLALEQAETEFNAELRRALLTFVVIGAGPTGVEMAGAIAELARRSVSRDFRSITPSCSRVILIEGGERVLPTFPASLSQKAKRSLEELGVEVRLGTKVADVCESYVDCSTELIRASTIIWAAGVRASNAAEWLGAPQDRGGRLFVNDDLRVPGHDNIFAIGDTASVSALGGQPLPAIAPVAKQQGRYAADVILGRARRPFAYRDYGNLATIGRSRAVAAFGELHIAGLIAWLIWCFAHVWFLIGFRSRLSVMISWLWNYATFDRSARLITGEEILRVPMPPRARPIERKCA